MPTIFAHAISAVALGSHYRWSERPTRFWVLAIVCAILPDVDVIGFKYGNIEYGDLFGHRGFSHSLLFAFIVSLFVVLSAFRSIPRFTWQWFYMVVFFFLVTGSHGFLDAFTSGGLGVAFFSPFDTTRYFFPWRPVLISPIGIRAFFNSWELRVLFSEFLWIWIPSILMILASFMFRKQSRSTPIKSVTAGIVALIVGIGLLAASLLADVISIGDDLGFGRKQTMGIIAGAVITIVGLFLTYKSK